MLKLGFKISHMQVAWILRSQSIPPAPRRSQTSWREFVRQHAAQMLACEGGLRQRPARGRRT